MLWDYLQEAVSGPARFRFIVQPVVAILLGLRDGRMDWALGRAPYLLSLFTAPDRRRARLKRGLKAAAVPFAVAVVLDGVVQWLITRQVYLWAAVVVALLLIAIPYIAARGFSNRALRRRRGVRPHRTEPASPPQETPRPAAPPTPPAPVETRAAPGKPADDGRAPPPPP